MSDSVKLMTSVPVTVPVALRVTFSALAVKEALHNILRHAGPCEATLSLDVSNDRLEIVVSDKGQGFYTSSPAAGNGLGNQSHRMNDLGGVCKIASTPGIGTAVTMSCPLPHSKAQLS